MRYAIVIDSSVANVILADAAFIATILQENPDATAVAITEGQAAGIGDTWDGQQFSKPVAPLPTPEEIRTAAKAVRAIAVAAITVTTAAGNTFDGDEGAQGRMSRAVAGLDTLTDRLRTGSPIQLPEGAGPIYRVVGDEYEMIWVLADNSSAFVSRGELREALVLAGATQASIWVFE